MPARPRDAPFELVSLIPMGLTLADCDQQRVATRQQCSDFCARGPVNAVLITLNPCFPPALRCRTARDG
jgi:hypothetical protein